MAVTPSLADHLLSIRLNNFDTSLTFTTSQRSQKFQLSKENLYTFVYRRLLKTDLAHHPAGPVIEPEYDIAPPRTAYRHLPSP